MPERSPHTDRTKEEREKLIAEGVWKILEGLEVDIGSPHFSHTPARVARAFSEDLARGLFEGSPVMTTFPLEGHSEMILLRDIPVRSLCAHHLLPFVGVAHVAYVPDQTVVGLSKLSRVVDYYARRPQVQETLTTQIAHHIQEVMRPSGVGVVVRADHFCMRLRGVKHPGDMVTSALRGVFKEPEVRAEFLSLALG